MDDIFNLSEGCDMKQGYLRVFLILCFALNVYANEGIAIVKQAVGDVSVKRQGMVKPIKQRDRLFREDVLITGEASSVGVIFHDGSVLSLGEKSHLVIEEFIFQPIEQKFQFDINMNKGTAIFESGKIGTLSPESFRFKIPEGTIGIRGTKFLVEVK